MSSTKVAVSNYLGVKLNYIKLEMMPELMLLGTLEHSEVPTDDGQLFVMDIIHYEGKRYIMKQEVIGRWFDER